MLEPFAGLVLTGGTDVDPARYGQDPHPAVYGIDPSLENLEQMGRRMANNLWDQSGFGPKDVNVKHVYDGFSPMVWEWVEAFGYCDYGEAPDFWVFADVSAFKGQTLAVKTVVTSAKALDALKLADDVPDAEKLYREKHRPLFHFTSRRAGHLDENVDHRHDNLRLFLPRQFPHCEGAQQHRAGDHEAPSPS